jgi:poly-gamma-glutamate synthesis protein (capsule biosynthesis protein)
VRHWNFQGKVTRGYLIVHADSARGMFRSLRGLFRQRFAIRKMRLIDAYGSDDHRSMRADNTSAFNCREIAGRPGVWSEHAYGRAIDLNPVENPYVTTSGYVSPPNGSSFAKRRPHRKGMVSSGGKVVKIFARNGWKWGGFWTGTKDYQHFSVSGS